jgi:hypothetical protein
VERIEAALEQQSAVAFHGVCTQVVPCYCSACGGSDLAPPSENPGSAPVKRGTITP